jgi:hypothetical protein
VNLALSGNQRAQHRFLWDLAHGETLYSGGWGSGKSWAGARKLLLLHQRNRCPGLAVAPTYGDLFRFVLPALLQACQEWRWPIEDRSKDIVPALMVGRWPILLMSAEHPERFAGFEVGHIWGDEAARYTADPTNPLRHAALQIRSRLRHREAQVLHALWTTTPEGLYTWVQDDFVERPTPTRRSYVGRTALNSALPATYLVDRQASLPAELAKQYLEGIAVDVAGSRAHPGFTRAANVAERPWTEAVPLHLGADYNVDPMSWCAVQIVGDEVRVLDELVLRGGTTVDVAVHQAHDKGWGKFVVHLHPDRSSKARSTVGDPELLVMQRTAKALSWRYQTHAEGVNPPVAARISNLSRLVLDAAGRRRLVVHPRCTRVIDEMERTGRLTSGQYDPGPAGDRGHILDALGYVCWDTLGPRPQAGAAHIPGG